MHVCAFHKNPYAVEEVSSLDNTKVSLDVECPTSIHLCSLFPPRQRIVGHSVP